MQFSTLFAAALATFATSAVAAPSPCNCPDPGTTPQPQTVRVGYTLDLHPETPLGSLSCSATFAKNFPGESLPFSLQCDNRLISYPPPGISRLQNARPAAHCALLRRGPWCRYVPPVPSVL